MIGHLCEARPSEWCQPWLSPIILPSHEILSESEIVQKSQRNGLKYLNSRQPQVWPRSMGIKYSGPGIGLWAESPEPGVRLAILCPSQLAGAGPP